MENVVGRYRIIEQIGAGGMAEVLRATIDGDFGFRKQVAVKLILPQLAVNPDYVEMFLDECRLTTQLSHPNLPQTYEIGVHQGRHFLAMEFIEGVSLSRVLARAREQHVDLKLECVLRVVCQLLECLSYVHDAVGIDGRPLKIVHRDVSPANVMLTADGAIKLLDFGIARARMHQHHTAVGMVKGKAGFMSPEQVLAGRIDHRTDVYAIGNLLYRLAVGVGPFDHLDDALAVSEACASGDFPSARSVRPDLDEKLAQIIAKAMSLESIDRYSTAGAMLVALEALALERRVMPSARSLSELMRELFPERSRPNDETLPSRPPRASHTEQLQVPRAFVSGQKTSVTEMVEFHDAATAPGESEVIVRRTSVGSARTLDADPPKTDEVPMPAAPTNPTTLKPMTVGAGYASQHSTPAVAVPPRPRGRRPALFWVGVAVAGVLATLGVLLLAR